MLGAISGLIATQSRGAPRLCRGATSAGGLGAISGPPNQSKAVGDAEENVMGVERGAGARLAPEHVDIPRRRDMGESVFGEGAPVAVDAQQDSETQVEADVRTRVVDFLEPDGAARIGDEQAGPDARIRLQAAVAKFLVLEEAVARH